MGWDDEGHDTTRACVCDKREREKTGQHLLPLFF
jgi:hypothetical protein